MRLDPSYLHFITREQLRILVAIEIGMRNHQYVPQPLIATIGNLRAGETYKVLRKLLKNKLVVHVGKKYDGYKLTYLGYDYLALHTFMKRGIIKDVICKIGVGKQSDIYKCEAPDGTHIVLKLTRLGRRSFRTIKNNRQYIQGRTNYNWLYLSRLSSIRQFLFMQILHEDGFPTPKPIDTNRHAIVMSLIDGDPLCHIRKIGQQCSVKQIFLNTLTLLEKFASRGLIHGDFNEFNLLISQSGQLTVIDFPQCISSNHLNAEEYFNRDLECLYLYFEKMLMKCKKEDENGEVFIHQNDVNFKVTDIQMPILKNIQVVKRLDKQVLARGHIKLSEVQQLEDYQMNTLKQNYEDLEEIQEDEDEEIDKIEESQQQAQDMEIQMKNTHEEVQNDQDMEELMAELNQYEAKQESKKQETNEEAKEEDSQQEEEEEQPSDIPKEWEGLTAFQIRQKIKEEKRLERQKKKEEMSAQEYIKKALKKGKSQRQAISKGNYGSKRKAKTNSQAIKDGLQMGW